jgi:hypothetical protein
MGLSSTRGIRAWERGCYINSPLDEQETGRARSISLAHFALNNRPSKRGGHDNTI